MILHSRTRAPRLMPTHVDIVQLIRNGHRGPADVRAAIESQGSVFVHLYHVIGALRADDAHRWQTIARARNEGRKVGTSPWAMFVDDDVVLGPDCVSILLEALQMSP